MLNESPSFFPNLETSSSDRVELYDNFRREADEYNRVEWYDDFQRELDECDRGFMKKYGEDVNTMFIMCVDRGARRYVKLNSSDPARPDPNPNNRFSRTGSNSLGVTFHAPFSFAGCRQGCPALFLPRFLVELARHSMA